jgi:hypothetical protein
LASQGDYTAATLIVEPSTAPDPAAVEQKATRLLEFLAPAERRKVQVVPADAAGVRRTEIATMHSPSGP